MLPAVEPTDLCEGGGDDADEGLGLAVTPDGSFDVRGLDLTPVVDYSSCDVDERLRDAGSIYSCDGKCLAKIDGSLRRSERTHHGYLGISISGKPKTFTLFFPASSIKDMTLDTEPCKSSQAGSAYTVPTFTFLLMVLGWSWLWVARQKDL
jgi:hypothetical protein